MSSFLTAWYDPAIDVGKQTPAQITASEVERLGQMFMLAMSAGVIPRRLGADATSFELAADRKLCRRIEHVAAQCLRAWDAELPVEIDIPTKEAAQVRWQPWWDEHRIWLHNRRKYIATWGLSEKGDQAWAKKALVKLNNEVAWLSYAFR